METELSSPKGAQPPFSANVRCGQTAGWTKMPLGMEKQLEIITFCPYSPPGVTRSVTSEYVYRELADKRAERYNLKLFLIICDTHYATRSDYCH